MLNNELTASTAEYRYFKNALHTSIIHAIIDNLAADEKEIPPEPLEPPEPQ